MVLFACERIPAMGAPALSVDLLHKTCKNVQTLTQTQCRPRCVADSATQRGPRSGFCHAATNSCGFSHSWDPLTGKEHHGKTLIFKTYK
jgi:hypothetical protein